MEVRLGALLASHVLARAPFAELGLAITPTELTFQPRPGRSPVDDFLLVGKAEDGGVHGVSIGARRYPDLVPSHDETVKLLSTFARMGVERWEEIRARRWRLCLATGRQMPALEEVVKLTLAAQAARDDADFREEPRRTNAKDRQRLVQLDRLVDRARPRPPRERAGDERDHLADAVRPARAVPARPARRGPGQRRGHPPADPVTRLGTVAAAHQVWRALVTECTEWGPAGAVVDRERIRTHLPGSLAPDHDGPQNGGIAAAPAPGAPLECVDPVGFLGIRPVITAAGAHGPLPAYVRRGHDDRLAGLVARVRERQRPELMCLVGDSSTGKSRALWEAVKDLPAPWRVESINSRLRKATRNRGHFPSEQAALKVLYLAVRELIAPRARDVNRVAAHWKEALNQFSLFFEDRLSIR
ncbi:transposase [Streptomyces sp. BE303]|uniref:transposase n=1 Tax=Streptomyces sp. BE303 TaxID=3002528 RepID=UPI002E78E2F6|nr:hypothetical protein [Streptomyces sp. BE303]MED7947579.1 hypothetical protein [Streptomyces sp. BE303]